MYKATGGEAAGDGGGKNIIAHTSQHNARPHSTTQHNTPHHTIPQHTL